MKLARFFKYLFVVVVFSAASTSVGRRATQGWLSAGAEQHARPSLKQAEAPHPEPARRAGLDGASGAPVAVAPEREIQLSLVNCGFLPKSQVDGRVGAATISAIKTLQYAAKLEADGVYGPLTRQAARQCSTKPLNG